MSQKLVPIIVAVTSLLSANVALAGQLVSKQLSLLPAHHQTGQHHLPTSKLRTQDDGNSNSKPFVNNHYVLTGTLPMNGFHKGLPTVAVVDMGSHSTYVLQLQNERIVRVLTVSNAVGSADTPSPPGRYTIIRKQQYPTWVPTKSIDPKQKPVAPYNQTHKNPLGVAAIYLNKFDIDLHGTNQPDLIRKSASHGCIRHSNADIEKLYGMLDKGDVVYIVKKFRGKVLNRADFIRQQRRIAQGASVSEQQSQQQSQQQPEVQSPQQSQQQQSEPKAQGAKSKHSRSVSVIWYTVDT